MTRRKLTAPDARQPGGQRHRAPGLRGELMTKHVFTRLAWAGSMALVLAAAVPTLAASSVEPEQSDVATLKPNGPHRFFTIGFGDLSFGIFDADSGKLEGSIPAGYAPNLAIAPDNSQFLVSETYWAHGSRGKREDLVSIWDAKTLKLVKEITLPGRALVVGKLQDFQLSADGSKGYVYIMRPASSVVWLDLKKQAVGGTVELAGCALIFPWGNSSFGSLCGDGSLAMVNLDAAGKAVVTHTKPFFDANNDPIYENSLIDRNTGKALFLSRRGGQAPPSRGFPGRGGQLPAVAADRRPSLRAAVASRRDRGCRGIAVRPLLRVRGVCRGAVDPVCRGHGHQYPTRAPPYRLRLLPGRSEADLELDPGGP